jgi:antibiotic biosynthesis monooxygenase (ABM) superfamily enzyme
MTEPIQEAIVRTAKPGQEAAFEKALHEFVQKSLTLPGQLGVHVIRPAPGSNSRQYGIIRRFKDRDSQEAFRASPEYLEWKKTAQDLTEGRANVEDLCGLESWFTMPNQPLQALPQWKMAVATWLGVVPVTLFLSVTLGPLIRNVPFVFNNFIFNAFVVALLTWAVMPLITRILRGWLYAGQKETL